MENRRKLWAVEVALPVWWSRGPEGLTSCRALVFGVHWLDAPGMSVALAASDEWTPLRVWTQDPPGQ